ncbi:MAG: TIGR04086 family membrane protein [Clostridia bacterium]|nr:TIGR04086 family membrane protein [Clostridia bacterium]
MNTHSQHTPHTSVGRRPDRPAHLRPRQNEEPPDAQAGGFSSILRAYPITLGITALSALLLVTASALAVYQCPDPTAWISPASAAALGISALVGGLVAGKLNPSRPVAAGLVCGGLTAALLILLSLCFGGEGDLLSWITRIGVLPLHLLGGILTRPKPQTPTHKAGKHPARR